MPPIYADKQTTSFNISLLHLQLHHNCVVVPMAWQIEMEKTLRGSDKAKIYNKPSRNFHKTKLVVFNQCIPFFVERYSHGTLLLFLGSPFLSNNSYIIWCNNNSHVIYVWNARPSNGTSDLFWRIFLQNTFSWILQKTFMAEILQKKCLTIFQKF